MPVSKQWLFTFKNLSLSSFFFFPTVDEEALRKKITAELYKGLAQDRAKAEQELQAWLDT